MTHITLQCNEMQHGHNRLGLQLKLNKLRGENLNL